MSDHLQLPDGLQHYIVLQSQAAAMALAPKLKAHCIASTSLLLPSPCITHTPDCRKLLQHGQLENSAAAVHALHLRERPPRMLCKQWCCSQICKGVWLVQAAKRFNSPSTLCFQDQDSTAAFHGSSSHQQKDQCSEFSEPQIRDHAALHQSTSGPSIRP